MARSRSWSSTKCSVGTRSPPASVDLAHLGDSLHDPAHILCDRPHFRLARAVDTDRHRERRRGPEHQLRRAHPQLERRARAGMSQAHHRLAGGHHLARLRQRFDHGAVGFRHQHRVARLVARYRGLRLKRGKLRAGGFSLRLGVGGRRNRANGNQVAVAPFIANGLNGGGAGGRAPSPFEWRAAKMQRGPARVSAAKACAVSQWMWRQPGGRGELAEPEIQHLRLSCIRCLSDCLSCGHEPIERSWRAIAPRSGVAIRARLR